MMLDMDTADVRRLNTHIPARAQAILLAEIEARRKQGHNKFDGASKCHVVADALEKAFGKKHRAVLGG